MLATAWLLYVVANHPMAEPGTTKILYALGFGVAVWGWMFGLTGAALRYLSNYSPVRRYLADASYWVYLAHLPVVAAFQVWVGHWPLHWAIKYPFILVASFALLFLSYHFLVRPTVIGQLLNGRKYPLGKKGSLSHRPPHRRQLPRHRPAVERSLDRPAAWSHEALRSRHRARQHRHRSSRR